MLPDHISVLFHFRMDLVAIVIDIKKASLKFKINKDHLSSYLSSRCGISLNKNAGTRQYQGTPVDFGLVSSHACHCIGVKYHLEKESAARLERRAPFADGG